jgi:hypothetical protein
LAQHGKSLERGRIQPSWILSGFRFQPNAAIDMRIEVSEKGRCFLKVLVLVAGLFGLTCSVAVAGASPFDGTWSEVIVGENQFCAVNLNTSFTVTNGHLSQSNSSGTVSPNGSASGTASSGGSIMRLGPDILQATKHRAGSSGATAASGAGAQYASKFCAHACQLRSARPLSAGRNPRRDGAHDAR